jgi:peptide/nickel transport system substrate-binding protein
MDSIIEGVLNGDVVQANALTPNNSWKATGLVTYDYNPELSRQLLKEAGWDSSYVLDIVYYYGDQTTFNLMAAIQSYLGEVGIKCSPRKLEGDLSKQLWVPPEDPINGPSAVKWDIAYGAIAAVSQYEYYNRFRTGASSNSHTPGNSTLDSLLDAANATNSPEKQMAIFADVQRFENTFLPILSLYYQQVFIVESLKLDRKGAGYGNEQYNYDWKIQTWDIAPQSDGKKVMKANGGPKEFFEHPYLNPGQFTSTKLLFDHLIVADGSLATFRPQMAKSFKLSEDGLQFECELNSNLKWHDGSAITPEDVKFTFELIAKLPTSNVIFSSMIKKISGYQAWVDGKADGLSGIEVNGNKITINFDSLFPNTLVSLSQFAILPKAYLKNVDPLLLQQSSYWQKPIGSGPYKIADVSMNNYAVFVPFEAYHEGVGIIDEIRTYPSGESDPNLVMNAAGGNLDYAYTKSLDDVESLRNYATIKVIPYDMNYTRLFYFNKFPKN